MKLKISCDFELKISHIIESIGFRGDNQVTLELPFKLENFIQEGTSLELIKNELTYTIIVVSTQLDETVDQVAYLEQSMEFISFLVNRREINPHYGNIYAVIILNSLKVEKQNNNGQTIGGNITLQASAELSSNRKVKLADEFSKVEYYHDIMRIYYDGLKSQHKKSKYFHWFLVIEHLEQSNKYKELFKNNKLFSEVDERALRELSERMNSERKKNAIIGQLRITEASREEKLLQILIALSITTINSCGKMIPITVEIIAAIVKRRNALFHSGASFPEELLWNNLFPLATLVAERVSQDPECLL